MPPLPPLPADSTPRSYINYTSGGIAHTLTIRHSLGAGSGMSLGAINEIVADMLPLMDPSDSVLSADYSPAGTNVRNPFTSFVGGAGTAVGGVNNDISRTAFLGMNGKSLDGRMVNQRFFTILADAFVDTRLPIGVVAANVANWYGSIAFNGITPTVTISGSPPSWKSYLNIGRDAYWQRAQR